MQGRKELLWTVHKRYFSVYQPIRRNYFSWIFQKRKKIQCRSGYLFAQWDFTFLQFRMHQLDFSKGKKSKEYLIRVATRRLLLTFMVQMLIYSLKRYCLTVTEILSETFSGNFSYECKSISYVLSHNKANFTHLLNFSDKNWCLFISYHLHGMPNKWHDGNLSTS